MVQYCFTSTEIIRLIRDGEIRGKGSGRDEQLVPALRPAKTEETVSHRQNNSVKEVGPRHGEAACVLH